MTVVALVGAALALDGGACASAARRDPVEACKLTTGEALLAPPVAADKRAGLEAQLAEARAAYEAAPQHEDALITYGRRLGTVGRFRDAAAVFTRGCELHPDDVRMWRFRGHRWITLRQFSLAVADLDVAVILIRGHPDEVEPSLAPNDRGIDLDTLHENVYYHLAL